MVFRWNEWNVAHIARHGVTPEEAEEVAQRARRPYPRRGSDGRWLVWGATLSGDLLQVVYIIDENDEAFVIHARPLTSGEKRRFRRRRR